MSLLVIVRPQARAEFDDAFDWYEGQRAGLGVRFAERVQEVFDYIAINPQAHAILHKEVRAPPVRRFPYVVYYRVEPGQVVVLAVLHGRRYPSLWQSRA